MDILSWAVPIIVALITGGFSYMGVSHASKAAHDAARIEQEKQLLVISNQIEGIKKDVIRLEEKQDKHNAVIERTFRLEQQVHDLASRLDRSGDM